MNDLTKTFLYGAIVVCIMGGAIGAISWGFYVSNNTPLVEGTVEDMKIEPSGHFLGGEDYWLQLNNTKWYEIDRSEYYTINIGDYVIIYNTGRIAVIS